MNSVLLILTFLGYISATATIPIVLPKLLPVVHEMGPRFIYWSEDPDICRMERRSDFPLPLKNLVIVNRASLLAMKFQGENVVAAALPQSVYAESIAPYCIKPEISLGGFKIPLKANTTGLFVNAITGTNQAVQPNEKAIVLSKGASTAWIYSIDNREVTFKDKYGYFLCVNPPGFIGSKTYTEKCNFSVFEVILSQIAPNSECFGDFCGLGSRAARGAWG